MMLGKGDEEKGNSPNGGTVCAKSCDENEYECIGQLGKASTSRTQTLRKRGKNVAWEEEGDSQWFGTGAWVTGHNQKKGGLSKTFCWKYSPHNKHLELKYLEQNPPSLLESRVQCNRTEVETDH